MSGLRGLLQILGAKQTGNSNEMELDCWVCGGVKKMYFNTQKGVGYCQKCQKRVGLSQLVEAVGGPQALKGIDVRELMREFRDEQLDGMELREVLANRLFVEPIAPSAHELPEAQLPREFILLESGQDLPEGRAALKYLVNRGFRTTRLFELGFGFCPMGYYAGRVVIPFTELGKIVYWQARDFTQKQDPKILNPLVSMCGTGKSEVIFNYDGVVDSDIIVVCESWGSALAVGRHAVGLNGKVLSDTQFLKLQRLKAHTVMVLLDYKAEASALKVAQTLSSCKHVLMAFLPWGDPNEVPKEVLKQAIKDAKPFSGDTSLRAARVLLESRAIVKP